MEIAKMYAKDYEKLYNLLDHLNSVVTSNEYINE